MDRDLLRQSLSYHGQSLFSLMKCEQNENPDFKSIVADLSKAPNPRKEKKTCSNAVEQFISRKADLLFAPSWKSCEPPEQEWQEETDEPYAIMPPLEQFMGIDFDERRDLFYRDVERGDVVIGRINAIRDFGFFITLLCLAGGLERDIEDLELTALCPIRDVPSNGNHDDPLSYYQVGDLIRAGVKDIDRYHGKLTVSLQPSSLSQSLAKLKLGVISREDLPLHYCRGLKVASSASETYEKVLGDSLGFSNPTNVEFLLEKLGISETEPPSLMRGLQCKHFSEEDYGASIRKKQSASWALKCVKIGVDHFKAGRHVEAMNEYNKALEIDADNVEALVARGALYVSITVKEMRCNFHLSLAGYIFLCHCQCWVDFFFFLIPLHCIFRQLLCDATQRYKHGVFSICRYATKGSLVKAMDDFELALKSCPTHRNAKKYLCQTLVERGGQLEEEEKLVTAEGLYRKALALDETFKEAEEALKKLQVHIQKSLKVREEEAAKEQEKSKNVETSAEKLRKILKEEKRMKKRRRRSSSTSSSSTSSTSSDSSSSRRKSKKKKKRKRRRSQHSHKKRHRRVSSCDQSVDSKDEWYPAPANTSASFMNQKQEMVKLLDDQDWQAGRSRSHVKSRRSQASVSSSSEVLDDSRGRFEDDPFDGTPQKEEGSREKEGWGLGSSSRELKPLERKLSCGGREVSRAQRILEESYGGRKEVHDSPERSRNRQAASPESAHRPESRADSRPAQGCGFRRWDGVKCDDLSRDGRDRRKSDSQGKTVGDRSQNGKGSVEGHVKKDLPANLLDIFSQIAQFEKEKCNKMKK